MAKENQSIIYKNCDINADDMTITEITKDDSYFFDIADIFRNWNGMSGVDITIKKSKDVFSEEDDGGKN